MSKDFKNMPDEEIWQRWGAYTAMAAQCQKELRRREKFPTPRLIKGRSQQRSR